MQSFKNAKTIKGFYRYTRMDYLPIEIAFPDLDEEIDIVNQIKNDGVVYEFCIRWHKLNNKSVARLEIFDDAFEALAEDKVLFKRLSKMSEVKPDEIHNLLLELGYVDLSDHKG